MILAGLHRPKTSQGFSLIELLLAVALLVLLVGATVFNFSGLQRGAQLDEGAARLETVLRFARAHAANTGRKVQLQFELEITDEFTEPFGLVRVAWESDPLGQPGFFEAVADAASLTEGLNELVQVEEVHWLDPNGNKYLTDALTTAESVDEGMNSVLDFYPPITIYPDGSSDSAAIILISRETDDARRMSVTITAVTGAIRRELVRANESEPEAAAPEPPMEQNDAPKKVPALPREEAVP